MDSNLLKKVNRINELYQKNEMMKGLTEAEYKEQGLIREELINYYKFAINRNLELKNINNIRS